MASVPLVTVRHASPADLEILVEFSAAMAFETEGRQLDRARLHRGTSAVFDIADRGFYMVAEVDSQADPHIVGQLLITFEWSDWRQATFWWIQSVYVRPEWRRKGVYRAMHHAVLQSARQRGDVCGVRLYVEGENEVAQAVYRRVGLALSSYRIFEEDFVLAKPEKAQNT